MSNRTLAPVLAVCLIAAGCAPSLLVEAEHTSHPLSGWPVSARTDEDALTQANALLHWRDGAWYFDAGVGMNLRGVNGGGFYGPSMTGTLRVGREFRLVPEPAK